MRAPSHSLERALHRHVDGRRERRVVRREQQLREAAAEGRPVAPFAWSGEQHLLGHPAEMIDVVATGMAETVRGGLPGTVVTWPPCGQIIVSPTCRMGPGIVRSLTSRSARRR